MKKKLILATTVVAALVIGVLGATSSPVTSAPGSPGITKTPVPGTPVGKTDYRVWYNGECKVFSVPARVMDITVNGKTERSSVSDEAAVDRALGPLNPKLHRPATSAEGEACFGPTMGPPKDPPPGVKGPLGPPLDLNEACAKAERPRELLCP
jgi:hypothetical protein